MVIQALDTPAACAAPMSAAGLSPTIQAPSSRQPQRSAARSNSRRSGFTYPSTSEMHRASTSGPSPAARTLLGLLGQPRCSPIAIDQPQPPACGRAPPLRRGSHRNSGDELPAVGLYEIVDVTLEPEPALHGGEEVATAPSATDVLRDQPERRPRRSSTWSSESSLGVVGGEAVAPLAERRGAVEEGLVEVARTAARARSAVWSVAVTGSDAFRAIDCRLSRRAGP